MEHYLALKRESINSLFNDPFKLKGKADDL
jgi:hypothetical protein